jgi:hypothetical protein
MSDGSRVEPQQRFLTFPELFQLPTVVDLSTAGKAVAISINTAYKLVQEGKFPCPVIRLGHRYKVPTTGLMKALGIEIVPVDPQDVADGAAFAARVR